MCIIWTNNMPLYGQMRSTAMKRGRISNKNYTGPKMDREPSEIDRMEFQIRWLKIKGIYVASLPR